MDKWPRCANCGEIIGVYEPVWLRLCGGSDRHGSRLTLRAEASTARTVVAHARCFEVFASGGIEGPAATGT
jgi:hypothetical protein